ncbi:DUF4350 domain-containing protein [Croceiramulus getboli]|nr:DUF4350 domain-containing protein [Flavobacteriaceae bacterium YJPT1-3]
MSKRYRIIAAALLGVILLLTILEASKPEPVNWFPSYSKTAKIPLGTYVLHQQLSERYDDRWEERNDPPFEVLGGDSTLKGTYFFINNSVYFDEAETNRLLRWVAEGNTLVVHASAIGKDLLDTLHLETAVLTATEQLSREPLFNLSNPQLKRDSAYHYPRDHYTVYFSAIDTAQAVVLGEVDLLWDQEKPLIREPHINVIQQEFGEGTILLNTFPEALNNYTLLDSLNYEYGEKLLSYLPEEGTLYWDNHYKTGKTVYSTPLYLLLSNKYLKWAYYTVLLIALIWVLFETKRKQRSIPIVEPLPNQTLAFTKTIAGMYLAEKRNKEIARHQINHFLDYIRQHLYLDTRHLGLDFIEKLAAKGGKSQAETKRLIDLITVIQAQTQVDSATLIKLQTLITEFKH